MPYAKFAFPRPSLGKWRKDSETILFRPGIVYWVESDCLDERFEVVADESPNLASDAQGSTHDAFPQEVETLEVSTDVDAHEVADDNGASDEVSTQEQIESEIKVRPEEPCSDRRRHTHYARRGETCPTCGYTKQKEE